MIADVSKLIDVYDFEQDLLTLDRATAVKAARANHDAVCPCHHIVEVPIVPHGVARVSPRRQGHGGEAAEDQRPTEQTASAEPRLALRLMHAGLRHRCVFCDAVALLGLVSSSGDPDCPLPRDENAEHAADQDSAGQNHQASNIIADVDWPRPRMDASQHMLGDRGRAQRHGHRNRAEHAGGYGGCNAAQQASR